MTQNDNDVINPLEQAEPLSNTLVSPVEETLEQSPGDESLYLCPIFNHLDKQLFRYKPK